MKAMPRICVLYNLPSKRFAADPHFLAAEEDTVWSAKDIVKALRTLGYRVSGVAVSEDSIDETIDALPRNALVFNVVEWTGVDTDRAMAVFDRMDARGLLYTGSTKQNYLDSCDKIRIKTMMDNAHLPTPRWQSFTSGREPIDPTLPYPLLVKVSMEHSSVGLSKDSIVKSVDELTRVVSDRIAAYRQRVFAEALLTGREFQVTVLEDNTGLTILPPAEIYYHGNGKVPILTYESRWDVSHPDYDNSTIGVANLTDRMRATITDLCTSAFRSLGFRDYARFDMRCSSDGVPYFLELNSNPGLGEDEEYCMTISCKAASISFPALLDRIVNAALRRGLRDKDTGRFDAKIRQ